VTAINTTSGPESIESHYDAALAVPGLLHEIAAFPADGYVIACFGDPGLDAAREVTEAPVVGIAEAAMHCAVLLGRGFSVVTTLGRTIGRTLDLVQRYGMAAACRGVHACEIPVLALEDPAAYKSVLSVCATALEADGSDVIVLGCAGMADFCAGLTDDLGVPVVDGVTAATRLVPPSAANTPRLCPRSTVDPDTPRHVWDTRGERPTRLVKTRYSP
jgi:allantoin racemase